MSSLCKKGVLQVPASSITECYPSGRHRFSKTQNSNFRYLFSLVRVILAKIDSLSRESAGRDAGQKMDQKKRMPCPELSGLCVVLNLCRDRWGCIVRSMRLDFATSSSSENIFNILFWGRRHALLRTTLPLLEGYRRTQFGCSTLEYCL